VDTADCQSEARSLHEGMRESGTPLAAVRLRRPVLGQRFAVRDFNGDGKADLAVADSGYNAVAVLTNRSR
jgi:hypothetical protein